MSDALYVPHMKMNLFAINCVLNNGLAMKAEGGYCYITQGIKISNDVSGWKVTFMTHSCSSLKD